MDSLTRRHFLRLALSGLGAAGLGPRPWAAAGDPFAIEDRHRWRLRVGGEVGRSVLLSLNDLWELPSRLETIRLVSETGETSVATWDGVHVSTLAMLAEASPTARWVHVHCADGHRECFALGDLSRPRAVFAHTRGDQILGAEMGGPVRLVIPWRHSHRSVVGIERIEFQSEPFGGIDPLGGAIAPGGEMFERGRQRGRHDGVGETWSAAVARIEIPLQRPQAPSAGAWPVEGLPWLPPEAAQSGRYARALDNPSFVVANRGRTHLVRLGPEALGALDPDRDWALDFCPLRALSVETRLFAHGVLAEVDDPRARAWSLAALEDASPRVAALALDTLTRRGCREALPRALEWVDHTDDGLALTAIVAVGALAEGGDGTARRRLEVEHYFTTDPARCAEIARVLAAWGVD